MIELKISNGRRRFRNGTGDEEGSPPIPVTGRERTKKARQKKGPKGNYECYAHP